MFDSVWIIWHLVITLNFQKGTPYYLTGRCGGLEKKPEGGLTDILVRECSYIVASYKPILIWKIF